MLSSGDLVLQLINDILDLSKVESGVTKLEAAKFRPREVVKHVLQTAAASLQKILTLEGHVADDVPAEVIGDVLRIRQILTNLISNAIKFTHEGKVGMKLYVVPAPSSGMEEGSNQKITTDRSTVSINVHEQDKCVSLSQSSCDQKGFHEEKHREGPYKNHTLADEPKTPVRNGASIDGGEENHLQPDETINALPTLFKKHMQVGADMARKYGGTGLGLAICKQLVELMGGHLSVSSREHHGSTFTFILPYKVSPAADNSDDPDELSDMANHDAPDDANDDDTKDSYSFPSSNIATKEVTSLEDACSVDGANTSLEHESSMRDNPDSAKKIAVGSDNEIQCHNKENDVGKILLVEDNKINVMVTRSMMKQLGHTIDIVNNGVEAARAVQSCTCDLILMDVFMPVMDGLQATRLIHSFEETGSWDAAMKAGIEQFAPPNDQKFESSEKRMPIIASKCREMTTNTLAKSADECFANAHGYGRWQAIVDDKDLKVQEVICQELNLLVLALPVPGASQSQDGANVVSVETPMNETKGTVVGNDLGVDAANRAPDAANRSQLFQDSLSLYHYREMQRRHVEFIKKKVLFLEKLQNTEYQKEAFKLDVNEPAREQTEPSTTGHWEEKELVSRDGRAKLKANVFFASFDQRNDKAARESACTTLVAVIASWLQSNQENMPTRAQFDRFIVEGSSKWRMLCDNQDLINQFANKHFDIETVLQARLCPISVLHEKSFIGFFGPEKFETLKGVMSFDQIWDEIKRNAEGDNDMPRIYIVSWNDHFFVLKVDINAYYIIDIFGERLFEGCNQAYILRFDDSALMHGKEEKEGVSSDQASEDEIYNNKECCREFMKRFLTAIPLRELESEEKKEPVSYLALHQRLQIEFNFTTSLSLSWSSSPSSTNSTSSLFSNESTDR
ncbi:unnamed protein product [Camellia sinensis]